MGFLVLHADCLENTIGITLAQASHLCIIEKREKKSQRLSWVEIGALGGDEVSASGALLRKANLVLLGCGPGSWSFKELGAQMPAMLEGIVKGGMRADFKVEELEEVERWWSDAEGPRKLVKI